MKTVAVLGAHSALARSLHEILEERETSLDVVRATDPEHLDEGLVLLDEKSVVGPDLLVLAAEIPFVEKIAARADALPMPVLDLVNATLDVEGSQLVWPGCKSFDPVLAGVSRIAPGAASPAVQIIAALGGLGVSAASATVLESAASADQPGMDALSAQVQALFGMQEPESGPFAASLAFDILPAVGSFDTFRLADAALEADVTDGLRAFGTRELDLYFRRLTVPTFSSEAMLLDFEFDHEPPKEIVLEQLTAGVGIRLASELPTARTAVDRDDVVVGRIRIDGRRASLFATYDRLRRGGPTLAALALEAWAEN